ncbi:MAG: phage tail protein, partial [Cetobacterium sp.]
MRTDGAIITNAGQELLSYALANNKQVNFTKIKLGKGDVNTFDEAKKLTDVVSFYKQIPITSIARNNAGIVRIRSSFTNADFPLQVVLKEIGVFAVVEGKNEVLFGYVNDGEGESFPPGSSGNIVERVRDIYVGVSTNTQVTAVVDRSVVYATIYDLDEGLNKKENKFEKNDGFNLPKTDIPEDN